jgi:hypothetical protein
MTMHKRVIGAVSRNAPAEGQQWLNIEQLAEVEITSEDPAHPIESALGPGSGPGWRAAEPGPQTIRLHFANPQRLHRIRLEFVEPERERTQEYLLRWSADGAAFRDIARQQWNFHPGGATETEDHRVDLSGVAALELNIKPDISGGSAHACLAKMRIA